MLFRLVSGLLILLGIFRLFRKKERKAIQLTQDSNTSQINPKSDKLSLDEIFSWIQQREGRGRDRAYPDGKTKDGKQLYSIGYGHQIQPDEPELLTKILNTYEQTDLFVRDTEKIIKDMNNNILVPLNKNQQLALFSLRYNIGGTAFNNSTLLKVLNKGDYKGASERFKDWRISDGQINQGLVNRRELERQLFIKPI